MIKGIKNNKGFTLIELLAVIVILGILMIVAIPQVTKYIEQAKRDTFADTARAYINSARYMYLNDELNSEGCTLGVNAKIPLNQIDMESNKDKSTFGGNIVGYVLINAIPEKDTENNKTGNYSYEYYIAAQDDKKLWGIAETKETLVKGKKVTKLNKNEIENLKQIICNDEVQPKLQK